MSEIDTSAAAVERVAARGDVYAFEDAKGATNIGAFIRALAAERGRQVGDVSAPPEGRVFRVPGAGTLQEPEHLNQSK